MKFYDTCSIMEDNADLTDVWISSVTIKELENIKTAGNKDKETKAKARSAVRAIKAQKPRVVIYNPEWDEIIESKKLEVIDDNRIIVTAYMVKEESTDCPLCFYTEDYLASLIAGSTFGLDVSSAKERAEIYKGYKEIVGTSEEINKYFENFNKDDWCVNEYLIMHNTETGESKEQRWDGQKFVNLKLPPSKVIKGKNSEQRCALDALNNDDINIVAVLGGYGSGKTFLCMRMALHNVEDGKCHDIIGVRDPESESKEVGFLQGSFEDKTAPFFKPLEDSLSLDEGIFKFERLKKENRLSTEIPYYMKGRTFTNSILVCDEAEDFSESEIKLIGTRAGEGSKIYWCGDYKQSIMNKSTSNPLAVMCSKFKGRSDFACVCLNEDVRSSVSKAYSEVYDD